MADRALTFVHHDAPEPWLVTLREEFGSSSFCGCYEGDMDGMWETPPRPDEKPDYTKDFGTHAYSYVMGEGQKRLVGFIRGLLARCSPEA